MSNITSDMFLRNREERGLVQSNAVAQRKVNLLRPVYHIVLTFCLLIILVCSFYLAFSNKFVNSYLLIILFQFFHSFVFCYFCFLSISTNLERKRNPQITRSMCVTSVAMCVGVFFVIFRFVIVPNYLRIPFAKLLDQWYEEHLPRSFRECDSRVGPSLSSFLTEDRYKTQLFHSNMTFFDSAYYLSYSDFDTKSFLSLKNNHTLCNHGFQGNTNLYGLGTRSGLYLQWMTALLSNNLVQPSREELQKVYLIISMAICVATIVSSFTVSCTFGIEIEILHWMYWGGWLIVFSSSPSSVRLGSVAKWLKLDWIFLIEYVTHTIMNYHAVWFFWYAYANIFPRMPCGTYHFFVVPVLDPSRSFWWIITTLALLINPFILPYILIYPICSCFFASEIKKSIQNAEIYQILGLESRFSSIIQLRTITSRLPISFQLTLQIFQRFSSDFVLELIRSYRRIRTMVDLPPYCGNGIRLITPIDIRNRRFVLLYKIRLRIKQIC